MRQLLFEFTESYLEKNWNRFDSFVAGNNQPVIELLKYWLQQPHNQHAYVFGACASGCTRLLHASCKFMLDQGLGAALISSPQTLLNGDQLELIKHNHLLAIDNLDWAQPTDQNLSGDISQSSQHQVEEEALYELFDSARDQQCALLFAAHRQLPELKLTLPDLRTRLSSCLQLGLRPLNDDSLQQLAESLLRECGISNVPNNLGKLVLTYCQRDSAHVVAFIRTMQLASLAEKVPVSTRFVHKYLKQIEINSA